MFGEIVNPKNKELKDINKLELITFIPIVLFIVWIGIQPFTFMKVSENYSKSLVKKIELIKSEPVTYDLIKKDLKETKINYKK